MKRHHWILLLGLVLLGLALFVALLIFTATPSRAPTHSSPGSLDDQTMQVAASLYCPVCPNTPLDACETPACQQWRELIHQKLAEGQSPEEIRAYFVAQYGQRVLGDPPLLTYLAALAALLAGGLALLFLVRRWQTERRRSETIAHAAMTDEYRERIERDLKENG